MAAHRVRSPPARVVVVCQSGRDEGFPSACEASGRFFSYDLSRQVSLLVSYLIHYSPGPHARGRNGTNAVFVRRDV